MGVETDRMLTPGEVALLFRVDPKTVTRWAGRGRIGSARTPGGHRRFLESQVREKLTADGISEEEANKLINKALSNRPPSAR
jgi:excisionase family DNA binding protein